MLRILSIVLFGLVAMPLVHGLDCYYCVGHQRECKDVTTVRCDQRIANETRLILRDYFQNVPNTTSNNYECLWLNYTRPNVVQTIVQSCAYRETRSCSLELIKFQGLILKDCHSCSKNLCNPAAAVLPSAVTLSLTILCVFIAMGMKS